MLDSTQLSTHSVTQDKEGGSHLLQKYIIIPVPKNSKPSCLNDYRPVALTSIVMEVFERLLKNYICSSIPVTLDPLQFAYRPNRSTDDAIY